MFSFYPVVALVLCGTFLWIRCDAAVKGADLVFVTTEQPNTPRAALMSPDIEEVASKIADDFTICFLVNINGEAALDEDNYKSKVTFVSYFSEKPKWHENEILVQTNLGSDPSTSVVIGNLVKYTAKIPTAVPTDKWVHVCVVRTMETGEVLFYFDGAVVGKATGPKNYQIGTSGYLTLGQKQSYYKDSYNGYYYYYTAKSGMNGRMTRVNVFGKALSPVEVQQVIQCVRKGDAVNWETAEWSFAHNMMISKSTATPCPRDPCTGNKAMPKPGDADCFEHPEISPYGVTTSIDTTDPNNIVRAVLIDPSIDQSMTECSVSFWLYNDEDPAFHIAPLAYIGSKDEQIFVFQFWQSKVYIGIGDQSKSIPIGSLFPRKDWTHVAVTWSGTKNGETILYVNGKPQAPLDINAGYVMPTDGDLYLKQDQIKTLDDTKAIDGFNLKITDVNMFDRVITKEEVLQSSQCSYIVPGTVVNSMDASYQIVR